MVGFQIPLAGFRILKPWIPDSTDQNLPGFRIPGFTLHGATLLLTFDSSAFVHHSHDYRPNWSLLSSISINLWNKSANIPSMNIILAFHYWSLSATPDGWCNDRQEHSLFLSGSEIYSWTNIFDQDVSLGKWHAKSTCPEFSTQILSNQSIYLPLKSVSLHNPIFPGTAMPSCKD